MIMAKELSSSQSPVYSKPLEESHGQPACNWAEDNLIRLEKILFCPVLKKEKDWDLGSSGLFYSSNATAHKHLL